MTDLFFVPEILLPERNTEGRAGATRVVDIAAGRRAFISSLGLGLAGAAVMAAAPGLSTPASAQAAITDVDIANFALNLEYLEAEFYLRAAFGRGLDPADVTGTGTPGGVSGGRKVTFVDQAVAAYAQEIAIDEQSHVKFFRAATGGAAVARPAINLDTSFTTAALAAGLIGPGQTFDAYANDMNFLLAAYIFEDVGVTAFHGAAPLIQSKDILLAAAGVLAVEAYHAGLIRTVLFSKGINQPDRANMRATGAISRLRERLSGANDDQGIGSGQSQSAGGPRTPSNIVPTDANGIVYARTTRQVLNIVYGAQNATKGLFFPNGLNGNIR